ncbi:MAG: methyltransferase domain-containing protein [Chloroflexi bacterium]|nr:methyltransferase domain-containing protein [Chloroflexota bacterium]
MYEFQRRISVHEEVQRTRVSPHTMLGGAGRKALTVIQRAVPPGSVVFDIGCSVGYFLDAADKLGYKAVGLDVAKPAVELVRAKGYPVWHGTIDTVPQGWVEPQVCTCFFALHHMTDPIGFLTAVRGKFPRAMFIVSEYRQDRLIRHKPNFDPLMGRNLPPRSYSWWNQQTLQTAMERAGYEAKVTSIAAQPREIGVPGAPSVYEGLHRYFRFALPWLVAIYYNSLPFVGWPWALYNRVRSGPAFIMAVGKPR